MITLKITSGGIITAVMGLLAYNVEKTLYRDSDVFSAVSDNPGGVYSGVTGPGRVSIFDGDRLVFTGWLDGCDNVGGAEIKQIGWAGRDLAGPAAESDADPKTYNNINLETFLKKRLAPFGFTAFDIENTAPRKRVIVELHEREWDACLRVAREFGKHLWIEADGTLMAHTIAYATPPSHTFKRMRAGETLLANSIPVLSGRQGFKFDKLLTDVHLRFGQHKSQVTAQQYAELIKEGYLRRRWLDVVEVKDKPSAQRRAKQVLEESKVGSRDITYDVERKYISDLKLNQVVSIDDWYLKASGNFLVSGFTWKKDVDSGDVATVTLRPVEDAVATMPKLIKDSQSKKKKKMSVQERISALGL